MIFTGRPLKVTVKEPKDPLADFCQRQDDIGALSCQVSFTRYIGARQGESATAYIDRICGIDKYCKEQGTIYCRVNKWNVLADFSKNEYFSEQYAEWEAECKRDFKQLQSFKFPVQLPDQSLEWTQKKAFGQVFAIYRQHEPNSNDSKQKNFFVKFFGWIYQYLPQLYRGQKKFPKVVFYGEIKFHEYLFLYFLTLLGCDVLYINPVRDIALPAPILALSSLCEEATAMDVLPVLPVQSFTEDVKAGLQTPTVSTVPVSSNINVLRPQQMKEAQAMPASQRELDYEALAQLAVSVVKIKVYGDDKEVLCTGSGVVFHSQGYIVTNLHVVAGGTSYGIQYENEEKEYYAQSLVKCHQLYDLAVLKVDRSSSPLPIYEGAPLKRGQKIVAIGSPLGLFNSISDGIISGFREFDEKSMIQFTAPISPGSSGGALLDLQGRLVGVITGHFTEGQNLNVAMDFLTIRAFLGNLLPSK